MPASRTDDGNANHVRILSVLGGPLARAGPHPLSGLVGRKASSPGGKGRGSPSPAEAVRMVGRAHPYPAPLVGGGGGTLAGAMGPEAFLLGLVDHIYAAAFEPARWERVLAALSAVLGDPAIYVSLRIRSVQSEERALLAAAEGDPATVYRIHLDPKYHAVFMRLSTVEFPWASFDPVELAQRFCRTSDIAPAFVDQFLRPQGLAPEGPVSHVFASVGARPMAWMMIFRREGGRPLDDSDLDLLDQLVPHLRRVYALHCRLVEAQHQERALREVLDRLPSGVMLLDKDGRVVLSNRSADLIVALDDGIRLESGRPRLSDPQQDRGFQQLLVDSAQTRAERGRSYGKTLSVVRPSGRRSFASMIGPLLAPPPGTNLREAAAILFITDPDGSQISTTEVLQGLYELTPAEAELLRLLAEGRSLEEVARQRGITMNTARGQLKQVFAKTDTRRQGELVRLVLTGVASLGDEGGR
jgi:DNA-binding CsgD family transcriptional regulator